MDDGSTDGRSNLGVWQMIRSVEDVKWTLSELVIRQLGPLERRFLVDDDKRTSVRRRTQSIVAQAGTDHFVGGQQFRHLPDVLAGGAVHAPAANVKSRRVGENRRLHG